MNFLLIVADLSEVKKTLDVLWVLISNDVTRTNSKFSFLLSHTGSVKWLDPIVDVCEHCNETSGST